MTRPRALLAAALLLAVSCSDLNELADGVILLEVRPPVPNLFDYGDTARFVVVPRNREGDSVPAAVVWRTPDDSVITIIDSSQGLVVGNRPGTGGRVQAALGDYRTGLDSVKFQARADTLIVPGPLRDTVPADATDSDPLVVRLESFDPPGALAGRPVIFTVVEPAFPTPDERTVELPNAALVDTAATGPEGTPSPEVRLRRRAGFTAPDSAIVETRAHQARGALVPGSGQRFVIYFARE